MNKKLAYIVIIASSFLLILNLVTADYKDLDKGFYFRAASNIFLIIAMLAFIFYKNKDESN